MKKISALLFLMPFATAVSGQAITINSTDMPVPTAPYNVFNIYTSGMTNPVAATNATWDYSIYSGPGTSVSYPVETDTFFTNAGVDVNYPTTKEFNSLYGYNVTEEIDFNTSNIKESGLLIPAQGYSLSVITGNAGDTLIIPLQKSHLPTAKVIVQFPATMSNAWHSVSHHTGNMILTVTPLYTNAPMVHSYYMHRDDTIVGWGKMRAYTMYGPSIYYNVLMDRESQYAMDSFYISGVVPPTTVLTTFGIAEGQYSDTSYHYYFYRKGSFNPMLNVFYDKDYTYGTPSAVYSASDSVLFAGVGNVNDVRFTTVLFPNPSNSEVNMLVNGATVGAATYTITDVAGRPVQTGCAEVRGKNQVHINLDGKLANGNYILGISDQGNNLRISEQFTIQK